MPQGAKIAVTLPAGAQGWPLARFAAVADRVILMDYDQHWQGGQPGPIAAQGWFARPAEAALRAIGAARIVVAQIGRASCRERVCQYVSIAVDALSYTQ